MMGWYAGSGWGTGAWIGMGIGMMLFWGLIILAVVALVRGAARGRERRTASRIPNGRGSYTAFESLDDRFARGELTQDEYLRMRDTLLGR